MLQRLLEATSGSSRVLVTLTIIVSALAFGCSENKFSGSAKRNGAEPGDVAKVTPNSTDLAVQDLALSCAQQADPSKSTLAVHMGAGEAFKVRFKGELCLTSQPDLTVVFVVDWSGSMQGNDPVVNGSCGRAQAAQSILTFLKQQPESSNATIKVGMVPFSTTVVTSAVIEPVALDQFAARIGVDTFCQQTSATNYVAAFQRTEQMLTSVTGRSVVYFISDGAPNIDATGIEQNFISALLNTAVQDSITAGKHLQAAVPGLSINSLLLGSDGTQAKAVMGQIAGDDSRVRLVAQASDLAGAILKFPPPTLAGAAPTASISAPGGASSPVTISTLTSDPQHPLVWSFTTDPFLLTAQAHSTVLNTLQVNTTPALQIKINVTQD